jgi:hypothetical protein
MKSKCYIAAISKYGDSVSSDWNVLAAFDGLLLMSDNLHICYVASCDLVCIVPYNFAVAEGSLLHFAGDSTIDEVLIAVNNGLNKSKILEVLLDKSELDWLASDDIVSLVHSVEVCS